MEPLALTLLIEIIASKKMSEAPDTTKAQSLACEKFTSAEDTPNVSVACPLQIHHITLLFIFIEGSECTSEHWGVGKENNLKQLVKEKKTEKEKRNAIRGIQKGPEKEKKIEIQF